MCNSLINSKMCQMNIKFRQAHFVATVLTGIVVYSLLLLIDLLLIKFRQAHFVATVLTGP